MLDFRAKMHQKSISAGAPPQIQLGELTALPKKYMKFVKLILRKIMKIFATRCLISGLKCTKNRFRRGSLQRARRPSNWIWGPYFKGVGRGRESGGGEGREGEGRERGREGRGGKGKGRTSAIPNFFRPWFSSVELS